jgi:hypothetical protein
MGTNDDSIHLLPLVDYGNWENSMGMSEDDSLKVVSVVDEGENELIDMTSSLFFTSSNSYSKGHFRRPP